MVNKDRSLKIAKYAVSIFFVVFVAGYYFDNKEVLNGVSTLGEYAILAIGFLAPAFLWSDFRKQGIKVLIPWAHLNLLLMATVLLAKAVL